jgi:exodeoxyribonuclease VII small subunit
MSSTSPQKKPRPAKSPPANVDPVDAASSLSFEEALAALAEVVEQLEQGDLGLSESLASYEQGVKLLKHCYCQLEAAERRVEMLKGFDAQGNAIVASFDEQAMSLEEKAASRGSRRSAQRAAPDRPLDSSGDDAVDDSSGLF